MTLIKITKKFEYYIKNKNKLKRHINNLVFFLIDHEFFVNTNKKYLRYSDKQKNIMVRGINKDKDMINREKEQAIKELSEEQQIESLFLDSYKNKKEELYLTKRKPKIFDLGNKKIKLLGFKTTISNPEFDRLIHYATSIEKFGRLVYLLFLETAILTIKIGIEAEAISEMLDQEINIGKILDKETKLNKNY